MYLVVSLFGFEGRIWDLIVSVPDHCLSFYFSEDYLNTAPPKGQHKTFHKSREYGLTYKFGVGAASKYSLEALETAEKC